MGDKPAFFGDRIHNALDQKEIQYEIKTPPVWYIQGSYVLDKIFGVRLARDVDIFAPQGGSPPQLETIDDLPVHLTEVGDKSYFPPVLGTYNTDRYLLDPAGQVIKPSGFPERPIRLELLPGRKLSIVNVVRGVKVCKRYGLEYSPELKDEMTKSLRKLLSKQSMAMLMIFSESDLAEFIKETVEAETSEEERGKVWQEMIALCPKLASK